MPPRLTGEVMRSCSVFSFFSSLKVFMVRRGIRTMSAKIIVVKYDATLLSLPSWMVNMENAPPLTARNIAM